MTRAFAVGPPPFQSAARNLEETKCFTGFTRLVIRAANQAGRAPRSRQPPPPPPVRLVSTETPRSPNPPKCDNPPHPPSAPVRLRSLESHAHVHASTTFVDRFWGVFTASLRVNNVPTLFTIGRPRVVGADSVYNLQTAMPVCPAHLVGAKPPTRASSAPPRPPPMRLVKRGAQIRRNYDEASLISGFFSALWQM